MDPARTIVAVRPGSALEGRPRLFAALEAAFGVAFRPWSDSGARPQAVVAFGDGAPTGDVPTLVVSGEDGRCSEERVELLSSGAVDRRVRGLALTDCLTGSALAPGDAVLARAGRGVAWTRSPGPVLTHQLRCPLPELESGDGLWRLLLRRPVALIALVHFLRDVTAAEGWRAPPLRASIVFDDPNLRWRSYGFIDYGELVAHADRHGYHAAMAMIPLDAGRAHAPTVALFRQRRDRLSLVFHGNDHVKRELVAPRDRTAALAMTAQALRRVAGFERRSGLGVDRVMMPPHGLCSRTVAGALAALGFDGLCAIHPLPWTDERPAAMPLLGWRAADWVDGCAVVPRIHLNTSATEIALRAFLDQPLVLYGHHNDVAGGLEPLAEVAATVNRLGAVHWTSVGEIARTNEVLRVGAGRATVRPLARRITLELPPGVTTVDVEAPVDALDPTALTGWSLGAGPARSFGTPVRSVGAGALDVRLHGRADVVPGHVAAPAWRPWPRLRRAATEARDRALPLKAARVRP